MDKDNTKNACFLRLYTNIQAKLYSFILAVIHNRNDADELFQETTVILWDQFDKYQEGSNFGSWAIGIAKNKVFEYLRGNKKTKAIFNERFYEELSEVAETSPDDISDRVRALKSCIEKLKAVDVKLLNIRYSGNVSMQKISQLTGRSTNSLYKTMSRIILSLRKCISRTLATDSIL